MGSLLRRIFAFGEEVAPLGRVTRLQLRLDLELVVTLVVAVLALASATAYQLLVHRKPGRRPSWL